MKLSMPHEDNEWNGLSDAVRAQSLKKAIYDDVFIGFCESDCRNKTVLDYGCGTGDIAQRLMQIASRVDGFDPSAKMRAAAEKNPKFMIYSSEADLPCGAYDVVLCSLVLCVVDRDEVDLVMQRIYSCLKIDGMAYIGFCNPVDFDVPETSFQIRELTDHPYEVEHEYRKQIKMGDDQLFEITEHHRPLDFYENLFRLSRFLIEEKRFSHPELIEERTCSDFVMYRLEKNNMRELQA